MRLVNPESFDPWRIEGIAHNSADFVAPDRDRADSLEAAVADCVHVARADRAGPHREAAHPAAARGGGRAGGAGARRAGRHRGRAGGSGPHQRRAGPGARARHHPDRPAQLLAQPGPGGRDHGVRDAGWPAAATTRRSSRPARGPRRPPRPSWRSCSAIGGRALWAIDFFKTRRSESVMRSFREIMHRAELDGREASLVRAMGIEVVRYLERVGVRR